MQNHSFFVIFLLHFTFYYKYCQESYKDSTRFFVRKIYEIVENPVFTGFSRILKAKFYHNFYWEVGKYGLIFWQILCILFHA